MSKLSSACGVLAAVGIALVLGAGAGWLARELAARVRHGPESFPRMVAVDSALDSTLAAEAAWRVGAHVEGPDERSAWRVERRIDARRDADGLIALTIHQRATRPDLGARGDGSGRASRVDLHLVPQRGEAPEVSARVATVRPGDRIPIWGLTDVTGRVSVSHDGARFAMPGGPDDGWVVEYDLSADDRSDTERFAGRVALTRADLTAAQESGVDRPR